MTQSGNIDVVLSPAEIDLLPEREMGNAVAVVFDILRATSTMITALANGADGIWPVRSIEDALALKKTELPEALLGGERHGERIEGFDLGNSPLEYDESVLGREIISTTTNGTIALRAAGGAERGAASVLAGSILNIGAIAKHLGRDPEREIVMVCAGTFREAALEDILAAGMLISLLPGRAMTDAALLALALYRQDAHDIPGALRRARNGKVLVAKGREAEIDWCGQIGRYDFIAEMDREGCVRIV